MQHLDIGTSAVYRVTPERRHLACAIGNAGVEVVSTPALIGFLEQASYEAIRQYFDAGEGSVGTAVNVQHLAAAGAGREIECHATVTGIERRRYDFEVRAHQGATLLMRGTHQRYVLDLDRFQREHGTSAAVTRGSMTFYFDVHSPWCYLAALRIGDMARAHALALEWRPLHLPTLLQANGDTGPTDRSPAFVRWFRQDLQDWARLQGVSVRYHPRFPLRNNRALRLCAWAIEQGHGEAFVRRCLQGYWSEQADIEQPQVLAGFAADAQLDPHAVQSVIDSDHYKQVVHDNTQAALASGVFGVPTVELDGKLFFGNDRLDMLERRLVDRQSSR